MALLTLQTFYTRIQDREYTDSTYTSAKFLEDAHFIAQDLWSDAIRERKGDINWDIWLADTVSLQYEYTRPSVTSIAVGADQIESVSVAYSSDTYHETGIKKYTRCRKATFEEKKEWDYHLENQPKDNPIYFESDGSIFIAPDPRTDEVGVGRLKITGSRSLASNSWSLTTDETEMKFPLYMHDALYYGIVWKANEFMKRDDNTIATKKQNYRDTKIQAIRKSDIEQSESYDNTNLSQSSVSYKDSFIDAN